MAQRRGSDPTPPSSSLGTPAGVEAAAAAAAASGDSADAGGRGGASISAGRGVPAGSAFGA
eukprot:4095554-Prymnesium_polylepis.1